MFILSVENALITVDSVWNKLLDDSVSVIAEMVIGAIWHRYLNMYRDINHV